MVTTLPGLKSRRSAAGSAKTQAIMLLVFSIGGRRMAAPAKDVGGISSRSDVVTMPVPSGTPHIAAVLRRGEEILPIFDLAGRLGVEVTGGAPLCLIVKRRDGPMAVCIDGEMPTLQSVDEGSIQSAGCEHSDVIGTCRIGAEELPVYALAQLGLSAIRRLEGESGGSYAKSFGR